MTRRGLALAAAVGAVAVVGLAAATVAIAARAAEMAVRARAVAASDLGVAHAALATATRWPVPDLPAAGASATAAMTVASRSARVEWARYAADVVRLTAASGGAWVGMDGTARVDSAGVAWFVPLASGARFAR